MYQLINEIKLSRVLKHFNSQEYPVGIMTAFRGENTLKQNEAANSALASSFRKLGFGFVWIDGAWIENRGTKSEEHVSEVSILVIGSEGDDKKMFSSLVEGSKKYNQDAFVYKGSGKKIGIYDKNGSELVSFDRVAIDKIADNYSKLRSSNKGRTFVFEDVRDASGYGYSLKKYAESKKQVG